MSKLESVEVFLVHCSLVNSNYQQASKVLFTFAPNKQLGQLLSIPPHLLTMLSSRNTQFSSIKVCLLTKIAGKLKLKIKLI